MLSEPRFITRPAQPYAYIPLAVKQEEIPLRAPPLVPEILKWTAAHARQTGPVFFNYVGMVPGQPMAMEVGAPIAAPVEGDGRVRIGQLPGGRYVTVTWTGPYDQLNRAHMTLHDWLKAQNLVIEADAPGGRTTLLEIYLTDPDDLPDPKDWITEIAFKIKD